MPKIALPIITIAAVACSSTLGLNDVTRNDAGAGELDRIAALEDQLTAMKTSQDAVLAALRPVAFRAARVTDASVPGVGSAGTLVEFDQVDLDTHHQYDLASHKYVIPVRGEYIAVAIVGYNVMDKARANCEIWVDKAGASSGISLTAVTTPANSSGVGDKFIRITSVATAPFEAGDRLYVKAFSDFGSMTPLIVEARSTNFQIVRIPSLDP